ncbi:MAG TPA: phosphate acyltransferase PlsX [Candidatus Omnitrophota bacterium]|jgi:glycerol-3-phosphate acyltransferase PlsX|nr:MAG: Phosphate acyltransferase [Candidatus Omnitrophica bacterium ADurb.Bin314]HOE69208.1 phosphate acyltransferase PlsX [Candidatus Omnitrophota bacterium]HQB94084.1 phosphate acyltransferase PlsX [Candidatus Omnitrophota bacterium]
MIRIAVDGMGGDNGPAVVVEGAVQAANDFEHLEILLVGPTDILKAELNRHKVLGGKITIVEAPEVVGMGESPVAALKKKKNSSIKISIDLLHKKEVDAAISAGNTGAMVAASTLTLGMLPGVKRPGIAITIPTMHGMCCTLDVGANLNPSAFELFQYAIMADVFARNIIRKKRPSIGLLNIGEEESKGTEVLKEAYKLIRDSSLNFIGNIEGRDFFTGKADCIICDGFVGNVCLKMIESILETMISMISREIRKNPISSIGAWFLQPALANLRRDTNYEEAGGAPLLGVNGNVIIAHGISSARAIRNGIRVASELVTTQANNQIVEAIAPYLHQIAAPRNSQAAA